LEIVAYISRKLLGYLLSGEDPEQVVMNIHDHLRELATNMREYKIPVPKYTIFTVRISRLIRMRN
jgi:DNA polymerase alpha subunit A